jgi:hypothetical protein
VFTTWSTSIQKFGANSFQTQHQQNKIGPNAGAPRRHAPAPPEAERRPRHALPEPPVPRRAPCPRPRVHTAVRACAPWTASPSVASPPYARRLSRRSTAGISAVVTTNPSPAYLNPSSSPPHATPRSSPAIATAALSLCPRSRSPQASCSGSFTRHP